MLPPHSGHTQFKMPDITSELALTVPHLDTCIYTSTSHKELSVICHPPSSDRAHCMITKLHTPLYAFCVPILRREIVDGGFRLGQKNATRLPITASENNVAMPTERQSPSQSCLPHTFQSAAKAACALGVSGGETKFSARRGFGRPFRHMDKSGFNRPL